MPALPIVVGAPATISLREAGARADAISALVNLGYAQGQAMGAIDRGLSRLGEQGAGRGVDPRRPEGAVVTTLQRRVQLGVFGRRAESARLTVALIVGTTLNLINQGDAIFSGPWCPLGEAGAYLCRALSRQHARRRCRALEIWGLKAMAQPERLIERAATEEDVAEAHLRPQTLSAFVGQDRVRANLKVFIEAARGRGEALDHVLLSGPPGLGKNDTGADHRPRTRRRLSLDLRAGDCARRGSRGDPHQLGGARRSLHRRDPPPVAGGRGDSLPGDGGLRARSRHR